MSKKIKVKDSLYILKDAEDQYVFISTSTRKIKKFKVDPLVKRVIDLLDSECFEEELIDKLDKEYGKDKVVSCLKALETEGITRSYESDFGGKYKRQLLFLDELTDSREETLRLQRKIGGSKIAVFGVGGIGTWIVNSLYQMGVGEIRIVDDDKIEESNLNRQLFFDSQDIEKYKVDVIRKKLRDANISPFKRRVERSQDLGDIVADCDFMVNCADSPSVSETTEIIDMYASSRGIPYCVSGGYNLHLGMVGPVIIPGVTKSFKDFLEYQKSMDPLKDLEKVRDIRQTGNLGPIAGAIANIQSMEVFKYLTGKGKLNLNRFAEIDFLDLSVQWREF